MAFVPAEKIALFKLIGHRVHHNDLEKNIMSKPDFDQALFWEIADILKARLLVVNLSHTYGLGEFK